MADFQEALKKTLAWEGGYVDDPDDAGGETFCGIARRYHPSWSGWEIIEKLKQNAGGGKALTKELADNNELKEAVSRFYKESYWERFQGDMIPDQAVAEELFDTGVNMGLRQGVSFLQEALNLLNRNGQSYDEILEDGLFGPATLSTLEAYCNIDSVTPLLTVMNLLQGMRYIESMRRSPVQEKYARGWLKRVKISR